LNASNTSPPASPKNAARPGGIQTLWRDTQRQLNELGTKVLQLSEESVDITIKLREADSRLEARIHQLADESRAADQRLEERIGSLVSAIGQFLTKSQ